MKWIETKYTCAIALGLLTLLASASVYAQDDPDAGVPEEEPAVSDAEANEDGPHPPHLIASPPPQYPPGRAGEGVHPTVILRITVTSEAKPMDIVVEH
ncbi:MAG: hypothetical protein JRD94_12500, partial [Deltaproteobacteria bacterium]|nr:hypothetical protein [Deltaproteobacteria bacterium]